jgi:ferredoxin-NADP reductase/Na+-translocating ferredoxin:NAD+ oxidoreductase RnfD subunit
MFKWIDDKLNKVTMYRLVLYVLLFLLVAAFVLSALGLLPFSPLALLFSVFFLTTVCWIANLASAKVFHAPTNVESMYITALILALIISPPSSPHDGAYFAIAAWASIWAMASKYVFAVRNKHIFNPAAFAVALTALTINQSASWWVGTFSMLPFVLVTGLLIVRKIRRADLMLGFFPVALISVIASGIVRHVNPFTLTWGTFVDTPILFFAFVMLTEPLTAPHTKNLRIMYGALVGFLFAPWVHVGSLYFTPELALLVGNVFAYAVSPKAKLMLNLKKRILVADNTHDFVFKTDRPLAFKPGQYMEWTLEHEGADSRGNRRYFTIASSPTEKDIRMGVKFYPFGSSFKHALLAMTSSDTVVASQLAGDFVMPKDASRKLVFMSGGIGVTPFRSMIKYLVDRREQRDIVHFYSNKTVADIAYADVFEAARNELGINTVYTLTDHGSVPAGWQGKTGFVDAKMIAEEVPDYADRTFYLSGPRGMIVAFEKTLKAMGIPGSRIKMDFFPGFA